MSGYTTYRKWRSFCTREDEDGEPQQLTQAEQDGIETSDLNSFVGLFILVASNINSASRFQKFSTTLFARYHGLSGYGQNVLAASGLLMPQTSYRRELQQLVTNTKIETR